MTTPTVAVDDERHTARVGRHQEGSESVVLEAKTVDRGERRRC